MCKRTIVAILFLFIFIPIFGNPGFVQATETDNAVCKPVINNREIVVQFNGKNALGDLPLVSVPVSDALARKQIQIYHVPQGQDYQMVLKKTQDLPNVQSAAPNEVRCVTNDISEEPSYTKQWYLDQIDMVKAKQFITDTSDITIAVLDTGVNANHPELKGKILPGYDFANDDEDPEDDNGHGTFVSGIIAANIDGVGIAGMTENLKILPIKIGKSNGTMTHSDIIEGIYYAIEQGVDIINMSYAGSTVNNLEKKALEEAHKKGILLVAATGNHGTDKLMYPASYPMVISVGAMNKIKLTGYIPKLLRASFSGYGSMIDVSAPGQKIYSTSHEGGYITDEGTSFATPMVSSLAALLKAAHPDWNTATIEWAIEKGAMNSNMSSGFWDNKLGYGVINVYESMILKAPDMKSDVPNDRSNAQAVTINQSSRDEIQLPQDLDWYQFSLTKDADVTITLNALQSRLQLEMEVYQKGQDTPIHYMQRVSEKETVRLPLKKGNYYMKVYEKASHWSESPYEVKVSSEQFATVALEVHDVTRVYEGTTTIKGVTNPYTTVVVKGGNSEVWTGTSDGAGFFTIGIPAQKQGAELTIFATNRLDDKSPVIQRTVKAFFPDVSIYADSIRLLSERSILNGYPDGNFKPNESIKKIQAIQILLNDLSDVTNPADLADQAAQTERILGVGPGQYGYESLVKAKRLHLLDGLKGNASDKLTRGEMAQLLAAAYRLPDNGETAVHFKDVDPNSSLYNSVKILVANDIVRGYGDGSFRPNEPIRRDHFAVLFSKVIDS